MTPNDVRLSLVKRLELDLIGPGAPDEVIEQSKIGPSEVYLTGMLWPIGERMGAQDDDGSSGDDEDDDGPSTASLSGQQRPCTMGVSFATESASSDHKVSIEIEFATYDAEDVPDSRTTRWTRKQHRHLVEGRSLPADSFTKEKVVISGLEPEVELHIRCHRTRSGLLTTVTLINRTRLAEPDRRLTELNTLFQTRVRVRPEAGTRLVPRPGQQIAQDAEEESSRLLFRNCPEFAAGHNCSVEWTADESGKNATEVASRWIPQGTVPAVSPAGHAVFKELISSNLFDARNLALCSDKDLVSRLTSLADAYGTWIELQTKRVPELNPDLQGIAKENIKVCEEVCNRIRIGIGALKKDRNLMLAFQLANLAMATQHDWKPEKKAALKWYPFQLGFILLAADSACNPQSADRETLDLLWFPTGGGKTEAYLAIIAMLAFYRRLIEKNPDDGASTAAIMRYTLRLLTAQQFERASSLILACDLIRLRRIPSPLAKQKLGNKAISIGLWVGSGATPNRFKEALETRGQRDGATAEQIDTCHCCQSKVRWNYDEAGEGVNPYCENEECLLGPAYGLWPVYTVDSDVYREKPTLVVGTIDKFALVPMKEETAGLFGFAGRHPPDLIIQDELHLISGPLGTIAGLYETAFDWLLSRDGKRPKVIGSTATIRRASEQVRALFDRTSCQFPPPGLDHDDSGFAVRDDKRDGRLYLGVTTAGRSAKFTLQAVVGSLLQSAGSAAIPVDAERDGYSTLLAYFNSLRELGGAIVQMLDDVPDSIDLYAKRRNEAPRTCGEPQELTSRVSQKEIVQILGELKRPAGDPESIDVVLATNMVSVGVDVSRLGLMVVNGQPKTRSEYIQATSRVGRSTFPGLVVSVLNAAKPRDRSHFETFPGWHGRIYRDVEATSVTPFASRARDRALHAILVSMIRHGDPSMGGRPDLSKADQSILQSVVDEVERRVKSIDPRELAEVRGEIDSWLGDWLARAPSIYLNDWKPKQSLLQRAERYAQRKAAGRTTGAAWPTMNNMRSVEPQTRFRMAEVLRSGPGGRQAGGAAGQQPPTVPPDTQNRPTPPWRRNG